MSLAIYMDENVNRAITEGLRLRGIDVLTVQEDGRSGIPDPQVLDRATELGRLLFTQDDDLLAEAHKRQETKRPFSGIVYAHQLGATIGECVEDLELVTKASEAGELVNRVCFIPL